MLPEPTFFFWLFEAFPKSWLVSPEEEDAANVQNNENDIPKMSCKDREARFLETKQKIEEKVQEAGNEQIKQQIKQMAFGLLDGMEKRLAAICKGSDLKKLISREILRPPKKNVGS